MSNSKPKINRLLSTVVMSLCAINVVAQVNVSRPRLVVSIVVDQLRTDYIEYLQGLLGDKGFKQLMRKGVYMRDVDFKPAWLDKVSATALIYTGAAPSVSGITGAYSYNPQTLKQEAALNDPSAIGNFTTETYSPKALALSTVSDEVMIDGAGLGLVYSIATDPQQAIIMAGHAGSGALWLNTETGKWSTSTYYKELPQVVSRRNYSTPLSARIDTMQWRPMLSDLNRYPGIPAQKRHYPFRYTFPSSARDSYKMWAASPRSNEEITGIAIDYLHSLKLGNRGDAIDMLNIGYTAAPYKYVKDGDYRLELEDTYLRLDSELGRLLDAVDKEVGLTNAVIFLSSTGYYDDSASDDSKYGLPGGEFSTKRAGSLLNAFYSARYGNADYVSCFAGRQVHLNAKTFEQKGVQLSEAAKAGKEFLQRMSGVADAWTLSEILGSDKSDLTSLRQSLNAATSGDIIVAITPGWTLVDETTYPPQKQNMRYGAVSTPAFIMAPGIAAQTINTGIDASVLAPTFTQILRIRSPNGASTKPIVF